jgi:hypothetical protein
MNIKCRVYQIEDGEYDESYNYLMFIPSVQPHDRDQSFYYKPNATYLGEWAFDKKFLECMKQEIKPRLKLIAYTS